MVNKGRRFLSLDTFLRIYKAANGEIPLGELKKKLRPNLAAQIEELHKLEARDLLKYPVPSGAE